MCKNETGCAAPVSCPWSGRGAGSDITGCRFSLSVMDGRYADIILGAVEKTDTSKVWSATDSLSTVYRGKRSHVVDAVRACFTHAYTPGVHMTLEATFSKGCPGDTDADCYLSEDDALANAPSLGGIRFPADGKIAFYPLGVPDYMEHIAAVVRMAMEKGLYSQSSHYATMLHGDAAALFAYFDEALAYAQDRISHYVLECTLSVNSPTPGAKA